MPLTTPLPLVRFSARASASAHFTPTTIYPSRNVTSYAHTTARVLASQAEAIVDR